MATLTLLFFGGEGAAARAEVGGTSQPTIAAEKKLLVETAGISAAEAEGNLDIQHRATRVDIVSELEEQLGSAYAGVWFDNETGEFVVPTATAGVAASVRSRAATAVSEEFTAAGLPARFRSPAVAFSQAELEAGQSRLNERLGPLFAQGEVQTSIDPETNAVVVTLPDAGVGKLDELTVKQLIAGSDVRVELERAPARQFEVGAKGCVESGRHCDLPMRGGTAIYSEPWTKEGQEWNEVCTSAFRANGPDGKKYILTAGHCAKKEANPEGQTLWGYQSEDASLNNHPIGSIEQFHFPGKDWAKINATGSWADSPPWEGFLAYWGSTNEYPVIGEAQPYKGETLCHIGANTGVSCGIVSRENVSVTYTAGYTAKMNTMFEVTGSGLALGGGDSGGPVIANHVALGMTSGGISGYSNATLYFNSIKEATAELNVNLTGPGAPEALVGAPSGTGPGQATVSGMVNPRGLSTNYVFIYGRGGLNTYSSWSSAGSGQGYVPVSTTLTGLEPLAQYRYKLIATNSEGTSYTQEGLFNTTAPPIESRLFLRNSNSTGTANLEFLYGGAEMLPVMGDWNGDGIDTPGLYKPSTGQWFLRNSNTPGPANIEFTFGGGPNMLPVAGDWNGDGIDTVGLYKPEPGEWFLRNSNSTGSANLEFRFGAGESTIPIAGDWNGDGIDSVGIVEPKPSEPDKWFLRNQNSSGAAEIQFTYGSGLGMKPVAGDWNADGIDTPGLYKTSGEWFLRNSNTTGAANLEFSYGGGQWSRPLAGDYNGDGIDTIAIRN